MIKHNPLCYITCSHILTSNICYYSHTIQITVTCVYYFWSLCTDHEQQAQVNWDKSSIVTTHVYLTIETMVTIEALDALVQKPWSIPMDRPRMQLLLSLIMEMYTLHMLFWWCSAIKEYVQTYFDNAILEDGKVSILTYPCLHKSQ